MGMGKIFFPHFPLKKLDDHQNKNFKMVEHGCSLVQAAPSQLISQPQPIIAGSRTSGDAY